MGDRPEDRAARVERILETGDCDKAMEKLKDEMSQVSNPNDRAAVLKSLKEQNEAANKEHWSLPNVEVKPATEWFGFKTIPGEFQVSMSHNAIEKLAASGRQANPFDKIAMALDSANEKKK
jgi:hypothetical protein